MQAEKQRVADVDPRKQAAGFAVNSKPSPPVLSAYFKGACGPRRSLVDDENAISLANGI